LLQRQIQVDCLQIVAVVDNVSTEVNRIPRQDEGAATGAEGDAVELSAGGEIVLVGQLNGAGED